MGDIIYFIAIIAVTIALSSVQAKKKKDAEEVERERNKKRRSSDSAERPEAARGHVEERKAESSGLYGIFGGFAEESPETGIRKGSATATKMTSTEAKEKIPLQINLKSKTEAQKAVIYSEIFNRKY